MDCLSSSETPAASRNTPSVVCPCPLLSRFQDILAERHSLTVSCPCGEHGGKKRLHISFGLEHCTSVDNTVLSVTTFIYTVLYIYYYSFHFRTTANITDGKLYRKVKDFKCKQLQNTANKTTLRKVFKPWPPSSFSELVGGHQSHGTNTLSRSHWCSVYPCVEPWWTLLLLSLSLPFSKCFKKNQFSSYYATHNKHTVCLSNTTWGMTARKPINGSCDVGVDTYKHTFIYIYCLHKSPRICIFAWICSLK